MWRGWCALTGAATGRLVLCLVCAFWLICASPAHAQQVSDPTGRVSVTIGPRWQVVDRADWPPAMTDAIFMVQQAQEFSLGSCVLTRNVQQIPRRQTRESLNLVTEALQRSPVMETYRNTPGSTLEGAEVVAIEGISVFDVRTRRRAVLGIERRMFLQQPGELQLYTLICSAHPDDAEAVAEAFAVADSLQVHD